MSNTVAAVHELVWRDKGRHHATGSNGRRLYKNEIKVAVKAVTGAACEDVKTL